MIWLSTIISIAPMIGFLGTVQGMIIAFDTIAKIERYRPKRGRRRYLDSPF